MSNALKQTEEIILAQWFHGENLEDIKVIEPGDFTKEHQGIVKYIKDNGLKAFERDAFTKGVINKEDYNRIHKEYFPDMYETHITGLMKLSVYKWIGENRTASISEMIKRLESVSNRAVELPEPCADPTQLLIDTFDKRAKTEIVRTGLAGLDKYLYGVRTGELTFVGARPSVGKSAFCLQMAEQVARQGKKVVYLSLEMSETSMWERVLLRHCEIPIGHLRQGLSSGDWASADPALKEIHKLHESGNFILIPNAREISAIKKIVDTHKPYMLVVDQLQQVSDSTQHFKDVRARFSNMTRELQSIALDKDVAVWCACQINRSADDSVPTMANLKEAGNIEEDATNVILLHRETEKGMEIQTIRCELAKQKEGPCGDCQLTLIAPQFTFKDVGRV